MVDGNGWRGSGLESLLDRDVPPPRVTHPRHRGIFGTWQQPAVEVAIEALVVVGRFSWDGGARGTTPRHLVPG